MAKALFINGSPRNNGNTAQLLKRAMDGASEAGAKVELVNLYDRNLNYKGCMSKKPMNWESDWLDLHHSCNDSYQLYV